MLDLKLSLLDFLGPVIGHRLALKPVAASRLPLHLRNRYSVFSTNLFGRPTLLAIEAKEWEPETPSAYGKHSELLHQQYGGLIVLVLPVLPAYVRNRMVQQGTPFIVPGSQIFIPTGMIDLRENYPHLPAKHRATLSPAAQLTVIHHLLRGPFIEKSLKDIAGRLHYSPMMMTKVKDELEAVHLCTTLRTGRSLTFDFTLRGRALWEQAMPHMTTPVKKTLWVRWKNPVPHALLAGISALSHETLIADDLNPTYALEQSLVRKYLEKGILTGTDDPEDADTRLEVWSYNPNQLADRVVDPLSLYLSLRYSPDERVQQQLEILINQVSW